MLKKILKVIISFLLLLLMMVISCNARTTVDESKQKEIVAITMNTIENERLKIENQQLIFENKPIDILDFEYEENVYHNGQECNLSSGRKVYLLRFATKEIPPPYTPYVTRMYLTEGKGLIQIDVNENFIINHIYEDKEIIWFEGNYKSSKIVYWDVLYLYDAKMKKLILINNLFEKNSVTVSQINNEYAEVIVKHKTEQPPYKTEKEINTDEVKYRINKDGTYIKV